METWVNSIKNDDILVTYDSIVNFINSVNLIGSDHHCSNWDEFQKYLEKKGYNSWSCSKKRAASNTFFHYKWGYHPHSPEYYRKR